MCEFGLHVSTSSVRYLSGNGCVFGPNVNAGWVPVTRFHLTHMYACKDLVIISFLA